MAFAQNAIPSYAVKPTAFKVTFPTTAKTVFTDASNTAVLVAPDADHPRTFGLIWAQPVVTLSGGVLQAYLYDGTNYTLYDEVAHSAQTLSTTAAGTAIVFTKATATSPLVLPEGWSLLVATKVTQTAGALIANAQLGKVF